MMAWLVLVGVVGSKKRPILSRHIDDLMRRQLGTHFRPLLLLSLPSNLALEAPTGDSHDGPSGEEVTLRPPRQRHLRRNHHHHRHPHHHFLF